MRAISISSLYLSFIALLCLMAFVGCGHGGDAEQPIKAPNSPNMTLSDLGWTKVTGDWTYGETEAGGCNHAKVVIDAEANYEITDCSGTKKGIMLEADFAVLKSRMQPVVAQMGGSAYCDLAVVADLSWEDRVTMANGKSKAVYYSSSLGTCATGNKAHGEDLDATLDSIKTKYSKDQSATADTNTPPADATPAPAND
jgi:hypothetical protein